MVPSGIPLWNAEGETGTLPLACTLYKSVPPVSVLSMYVSSCMYVRKLPVIAFELDTWNLVHIIPVEFGKKYCFSSFKGEFYLKTTLKNKPSLKNNTIGHSFQSSILKINVKKLEYTTLRRFLEIFSLDFRKWIGVTL